MAGAPQGAKPGRRVLLIDDEKDILAVMKDGLQRAGFTVQTYYDPGRALEDYVPGSHDLVITDIRMPGLTGLDLYRKIRSVDPDTKIIFLSAFDKMSSELGAARSLDDAVIIPKPIGMRDLLLQVKNVFDGGSGSSSGC
jgi:DNA-binding response OmpR family regulator